MPDGAIAASIWFMDDTIRVGDPVDLDLGFTGGWVYRLWGPNDVCLYVGQTGALHPWRRIGDHKKKVWWPLVKRCDYLQVYDIAHLGRFEGDQIAELHPVFNLAGADITDERVKSVLSLVDFYGLNIHDIVRGDENGSSSEN